MDNYILVDKKPVPEPDLVKWAHWMGSADRIVRKDVATISIGGKPLGTVTISTVFLGINHQFGEGEPLLFETMVFGGALDGEMDRCSTWEAAEKMHDLMCERVRYSTERANRP